MITAHASGTQTAVISTEHFLSNVNAIGKFTGVIDVSAMVDGDVLELRAYQMVLTAGTARVVELLTLYGAQPTDKLIVHWGEDFKNELTDANSLRYSIKQTFGTGRAYPWKVVLEDDSVNTTRINGNLTDDYSVELRIKHLGIVNDIAAEPAIYLEGMSAAGLEATGGAGAGIRATGSGLYAGAELLSDPGTPSISAPGGMELELGNLNQLSITQYVWDELVANITEVGSIGKLIADMLNAAVSTRSSHSAADVWAVATRGLTTFDNIRFEKNTAFNNFMFFMRQSADNVSPATGLTVSATRSIDGGAFAACSNAVVELGSGWYKINLAASDLNGDSIALKFTATGAVQRNLLLVTQV